MSNKVRQADPSRVVCCRTERGNRRSPERVPQGFGSSRRFPIEHLGRRPGNVETPVQGHEWINEEPRPMRATSHVMVAEMTLNCRDDGSAYN
jgi:hypothetical protein